MSDLIAGEPLDPGDLVKRAPNGTLIRWDSDPNAHRKPPEAWPLREWLLVFPSGLVRRVMARSEGAAVQEATRRGWTDFIAIVDVPGPRDCPHCGRSLAR